MLTPPARRRLVIGYLIIHFVAYALGTATLVGGFILGLLSGLGADPFP